MYVRADSEIPKTSRSTKAWLGTAISVLLFAALGAYIRTADKKIRLPFGHGNDGVYVSADPSIPASLKIDGGTANIEFPGGIQVLGAHVERADSTLKFSGGALYENGYLAPGQSSMQGGSPVDLATIGDDGQSVTLQLPSGGSVRFIRQ